MEGDRDVPRTMKERLERLNETGMPQCENDGFAQKQCTSDKFGQVCRCVDTLYGNTVETSVPGKLYTNPDEMNCGMYVIVKL